MNKLKVLKQYITDYQTTVLTMVHWEYLESTVLSWIKFGYWKNAKKNAKNHEKITVILSFYNGVGQCHTTLLKVTRKPILHLSQQH